MDLIDAHLHLIHRDQLTYNWMPNAPLLDTGDYTLADMKALAAGRITGSIFMEVDVSDFRYEARIVKAMMQPGSGLLGQIAGCNPAQAEGFDQWLAECDALNVVGFRRILHEGPDDVSRSDTFRPNPGRTMAKT